jgi:hypothetical protein
MAETLCGSVHESPAPKGDAQASPPASCTAVISDRIYRTTRGRIDCPARIRTKSPSEAKALPSFRKVLWPEGFLCIERELSVFGK